MRRIITVLIFFFFALHSYSQSDSRKWKFVNFSQVNITDNFWKPKIDKVATTTLNACITQTEIKTPRIRNFEKVANKTGEKHQGIYYDDSDVYKALEAMAYSLKTHPNPELEKKADEWIELITASQLPDGYINSYYTLGDLGQRWTDVEKHEDYCAGHLIEAAVAYFDATGKRKLLDAAIRFANHIDSTFRLGNKKWFSGHQEIELALVKLYKVTNDERYLQLADWYLQQRGKRYYNYGSNWITPGYWQDLLPVTEQTEITGHAVRAMYLYTGAADVGALTGNKGYMNAMQKVWEDVVHRNMYITGGIGSTGDNEGFSRDYDLPNKHAYCETCASVGMVFWNQRMAELTGDSRFMDVLERSLYNGALDGISLSGDRFFYGNPLASFGDNKRREWFGTACCPSNISRLIASLGNYIYASNENSIWVNLFAGSNATFDLKGTKVKLQALTDYPWKGDIKFLIEPSGNKTFSLNLRVPGWARGEASPGGLYHFVNYKMISPVIKVNGKTVNAKMENGYLSVSREWKKGDMVEYFLPMEILKVEASDSIKVNKGMISLQRGPIVYCAEGIDNGGNTWNKIVNKNTHFTVKKFKVLDEEVIALEAEIKDLRPDATGTKIIQGRSKLFAIPYYTWANRGPSDMQVWLPGRIKNVRVNSKE